MTKDELMDLAVSFRAAKMDDCWDVHKALSDAIGAALKQARSDALEEVLSLPQIKGNLFAEKAIRALKETK